MYNVFYEKKYIIFFLQNNQCDFLLRFVFKTALLNQNFNDHTKCTTAILMRKKRQSGKCTPPNYLNYVWIVVFEQFS